MFLSSLKTLIVTSNCLFVHEWPGSIIYIMLQSPSPNNAVHCYYGLFERERDLILLFRHLQLYTQYSINVNVFLLILYYHIAHSFIRSHYHILLLYSLLPVFKWPLFHFHPTPSLTTSSPPPPSHFLAPTMLVLVVFVSSLNPTQKQCR